MAYNALLAYFLLNEPLNLRNAIGCTLLERPPAALSFLPPHPPPAPSGTHCRDGAESSATI